MSSIRSSARLDTQSFIYKDYFAYNRAQVDAYLIIVDLRRSNFF